MKRSQALTGAALLLGVLCSCKTDQPLNQGRQNLQIQFLASANTDCFLDVWDRYLDLNLNNQVDVGVDQRLQPLCSTEFGGPQCVAPGAIVFVPIPFVVAISIVRAGTAVREPLTSSRVSTTFSSYTEQPPLLGETAARAPEPCGTAIPGTCVFNNERRVPISNIDGLNCFLPPNAQLLPANIAGSAPPFTIDVGPGDVVIAEARSGSDLVADPFNGSQALISSPITFFALLTLDGVPVTPVGTADSGQDHGLNATLSFSYTVR